MSIGIKIFLEIKRWVGSFLLVVSVLHVLRNFVNLNSHFLVDYIVYNIIHFVHEHLLPHYYLVHDSPADHDLVHHNLIAHYLVHDDDLIHVIDLINDNIIDLLNDDDFIDDDFIDSLDDLLVDLFLHRTVTELKE